MREFEVFIFEFVAVDALAAAGRVRSATDAAGDMGRRAFHHLIRETV